MEQTAERARYEPRLNSPATGVIVTGGASGIGRATARALAAVGRPVAIWDLDAEAAQAAASEASETFGASAIGLAVDVRDPAAIAQALERTRAALPILGGLVDRKSVV